MCVRTQMLPAPLMQRRVSLAIALERASQFAGTEQGSREEAGLARLKRMGVAKKLMAVGKDGGYRTGLAKHRKDIVASQGMGKCRPQRLPPPTQNATRESSTSRNACSASLTLPDESAPPMAGTAQPTDVVAQAAKHRSTAGHEQSQGPSPRAAPLLTNRRLNATPPGVAMRI